MERGFHINPNCLDYYISKNKIKFRKSVLQPRTRSLILDSMYVWVRVGAVFCVMVNVMRRNFQMSTYAKILGAYVIGDKVLPYSIFSVMEMNRLRQLKKQARKYYEIKNGDINNIQFFLDPATPVSLLRNFSF